VKKFGVNDDNNGVLNNSADKLEFVNDILEKIILYYTTMLSDDLLDINIKMSDSLDTYDINILTKMQVLQSNFDNFNLSIQMMSKLNGFNLNFNYFIN